MKKVFLLGICGIALAACDSATTSLEQYCLNAAKKEGLERQAPDLLLLFLYPHAI